MVGGKSQRQFSKCIKTDFSVPQQASKSSAIVFTNVALKEIPQHTGLHPLILLGPNKPYEVPPVLEVVRFYRKLMVRHVIINIILPQGTSHYGSRGMDCTVSINRGSL